MQFVSLGSLSVNVHDRRVSFPGQSSYTITDKPTIFVHHMACLFQNPFRILSKSDERGGVQQSVLSFSLFPNKLKF